MNYEESIFHHSSLKGRVLCCWELKGPWSEDQNLIRFLPKGQALLVFNYGDSIPKEALNFGNFPGKPLFWIPPFSGSKLLQQSGESDLFGISFIRDGAYQFFGKGALGAAVDIVSETLAKLLDLHQLMEGKSLELRKELAEEFLWSIDDPSRSNPLQSVFEQIEITKGKASIQDLADSAGISTRQLQRQFKERIGLSPKDYCKVVRVSQYLDYALAQDDKPDWMDFVVEFGYHDLPHLISEVKSIANLPPQRLLDLRDTLYHQVSTD